MRDGMSAGFGSFSSTVVEPDVLGRTRSRLVIGWQGLGERAAQTTAFEADDLDLIATGRSPADWARILEGWTPVSERQVLPWAVVHRAVRAPLVQHLHADAICALAGAPDGRSVCAEAFGPEVAWLPYAAPGPELGRLLAGVRGGAAVVQRLGLFAWGDSESVVQQRCTTLAAAAIAWLERRPELPAAGVPSIRADSDIERLLLEMRGRASASGPAVLQVDPSLAALADRLDIEQIVRESASADVTWPWVTDVAEAETSAGTRPDLSQGRVRLEPGLGLVCVGPDEAAAHALSIVAGHGYRVTALLIDALGGVVPLSALERGQLLSSVTDPTTRVPRACSGRVYIVTGAASGIGRDVARHLAGLGASLALGDLNGDGLERTADELAPLAGRPVAVAGDLTNEATVDHLVSATVRRFGGVDGAVLNAGIALPGQIRSLSVDDWRRSLDVNATSHFLLAKRLLPVLEAQGIGGSLVFIGSKNMFSPGAGFGAYSASKAALAQLARVVAIEAGPFGVRSNIVNPDNVFAGSALWSPELRAQRAAVYGIKPEELEAYYTQRNLMKVPITGEDIAKGVAFLLSDDAMRTTACVLTIDGGVPGVFPR